MRDFQPLHLTLCRGRTPVHGVATSGRMTGGPGQAEATVAAVDLGRRYLVWRNPGVRIKMKPEHDVSAKLTQ